MILKHQPFSAGAHLSRSCVGFVAKIVGELKVIEAEARETDKALKEILEKLGV